MSVETLAKKLFKAVTKYRGIVTVNVIKKAYPKFRVSSENWQLLILKLLKRDKKANEVVAKNEWLQKVEAIRNFLQKKGITFYTKDVSTELWCSFNNIGLGMIGWNPNTNRWYFARHHGQVYSVSTLEKAIGGFLEINKYNLK
jgi:hypothetical protein